MTRTDVAHQEYWESFYDSDVSGGVPSEPSAFAEWVRSRLTAGQPIVELGFGNARDSLWFARWGHPVTAFDFARTAVERAASLARGEEIEAVFGRLDLYDTVAVEDVQDSLAATLSSPAVYGRFILHSLEEAGRANVLDLSAHVLRDGGELYLEFRTDGDEGQTHVFGDDHFRVYLNPEVVVAEIEARGGTVVHCEQAHGLAVYKAEDPEVARIEARWAV